MFVSVSFGVVPISKFWYQRFVGRGDLSTLKREPGEEAEGRLILRTGEDFPPEKVVGKDTL